MVSIHSNGLLPSAFRSQYCLLSSLFKLHLLDCEVGWYVCCSMRMGIRRQLVGVSALLYSVGAVDQTQVVVLDRQQVPLPGEAAHQSWVLLWD